jgi:hypothetical protein
LFIFIDCLTDIHQVTQYLNQTFPERWIGRGGPVHWPPRSPDLTPLDFGLWGWMNSEVYKEKVNKRDELLARIMDGADLIKERQDDLRRTTRSLLLPQEVQSALRLAVGFSNNYNEV